ncbi:unnamed protein product [Rotaria magnacalcarata]|uniref:G-protein coupled receptors family 1 profile domain-containing protein n=4 Tax=Rotaria magnacalcarata TaxID=392030 RepID=A0A816AY85_9BILA|nr:unnamed protein product [Rotaria magnacalcarata]CAF2229110.1 unnamed protein product [Rotaria magnacalcarata]
MNTNNISNSSELPFLNDDDREFSHKLNIIQGCIYIPIFCAGIVNNLLTILIILLNRDMHTVTNCYLLNLAISDSLPLIVSLPFEIAFLPITLPWNQYGCKLRSLLAETSTNTSILTISAFTIERYIAVCRPLHTTFLSTTGRAIKIQILIWFIAILSSTPYLYITTKNESHCLFDPDFQAFVKKCFQISATFFFVLPAVILCVLYALMARRLYSARLLGDECWSKSSSRASYSTSICVKKDEQDNNDLEQKRTKSHRSTVPSITRKYASIRLSNYTASGAQGQNMQSMKKSAFKMLFAVVIAFIICYAPFHVQRLVTSSSNGPYLTLLQRRGIPIFFFISGILYYLGSTINPIFYHLFSHKYREACLRTMKRIVRCQRDNHNYYHHRHHDTNNNNNRYSQKTYKSPAVAHLVVCASLPRPSLHLTTQPKSSKTLDPIYQSSSKYDTSLDVTCNKQSVIRLSLPSFSTERLRV